MATIIHRIVYPKLGIIDEFVEEIPDDDIEEILEENKTDDINGNKNDK